MLGRTLALQFHPEVDTDLLKVWLADDRDGDAAAAGLDHERVTHPHNPIRRRCRGPGSALWWAGS